MFLAFLFSSSRAMEAPAIGALVPHLAKEHQALGQLNLLLDNTKRVGRFLAPLAASVMQWLFVAPVMFAAISGLLVVSASCAASLQIAEREPRQSEMTVRQDIKAGWSALQNNRGLFISIICFAVYNPVYAIGYWILLPNYFGSYFGGGAPLYSTAVAFFSGGALLSNVLVHVLKIKIRRHFIPLGFLIVGIGLALLAVAPSRNVALLTVMAAAMGIPLMDMGMAYVINDEVPSAHQGKVFSIFRYFAEIGLSVGLLVGGYLTDWFGAKTMYGLGGVYVTVVVLAYRHLQSRHR
jgi:predicted MFS family arabinose efflux permease